MRPVVIVIVLPLAELVVEQVNVIRDAVLVQELVELLVVDAVRPFDLAVQMRCPRPDVHVADIAFFEMPVEVGLEFGALVGLNGVDAERQPPEDVIDEGDGRPLIAGVVDLQHADPCAIVDGRELVEPPACAGDPLEKLDVDLQPMPRLRLLVPRPAVRVVTPPLSELTSEGLDSAIGLHMRDQFVDLTTDLEAFGGEPIL